MADRQADFVGNLTISKGIGDGLDHSMLGGLTDPLNEAGVSTLAVGKPGVDFFSGWQGEFPETRTYNRKLFDSLQWKDLVENVRQAVLYAKSRPEIDSSKIYVLGHSESTQVVADYAMTDSTLAGVILLGVVNRNFAQSDDYQVFDGFVDLFVADAVDANHDGLMDRAEASFWPEDFQWSWQPTFPSWFRNDVPD